MFIFKNTVKQANRALKGDLNMKEHRLCVLCAVASIT